MNIKSVFSTALIALGLAVYRKSKEKFYIKFISRSFFKWATFLFAYIQ